MAAARYLPFASMNEAINYPVHLSIMQAASHLAASSELRWAAPTKRSGEVL
jgi:hypothetical protein